MSEGVFTVTWVRTLLEVAIHLMQRDLPISSGLEDARHGPAMSNYYQATGQMRIVLYTIDAGLEREAKEK